MYDDEEGRRNSRRTLFTLPKLEENEISYYMGRARDDDVRKCGIPRRLHVVEGEGRWMLLRNIDVQDGLVNGAQFKDLYVTRSAEGKVLSLRLTPDEAETGR